MKTGQTINVHIHTVDREFILVFCSGGGGGGEGGEGEAKKPCAKIYYYQVSRKSKTIAVYVASEGANRE